MPFKSKHKHMMKFKTQSQTVDWIYLVRKRMMFSNAFFLRNVWCHSTKRGKNRTGGKIVNLSAQIPFHKIQVKIHPTREPFCTLDATVDVKKCERGGESREKRDTQFSKSNLSDIILFMLDIIIFMYDWLSPHSLIWWQGERNFVGNSVNN